VSSWKSSKSYRHKRHEPDALAFLRHADVLAGERVTEIDLLPVEADPPALRDGECLVVERVRELLQADKGAICRPHRSLGPVPPNGRPRVKTKNGRSTDQCATA